MHSLTAVADYGPGVAPLDCGLEVSIGEHTMLGLLPPSSRVTRLKLLEPAICAIFFPVLTLLVKEIFINPLSGGNDSPSSLSHHPASSVIFMLAEVALYTYLLRR